MNRLALFVLLLIVGLALGSERDQSASWSEPSAVLIEATENLAGEVCPTPAWGFGAVLPTVAVPPTASRRYMLSAQSGTNTQEADHSCSWSLRGPPSR